ncbi:MAG: hypothetical protein BWY75_01799 [bacterium ADurb.Bin425]|nr:MAG: hypothetical protein BWY75_01799 [bacterium ADurb.Bin425]
MDSSQRHQNNEEGRIFKNYKNSDLFLALAQNLRKMERGSHLNETLFLVVSLNYRYRTLFNPSGSE